METGPQREPSAREAREMLRAANESGDEVRYPSMPRWFFPVMAVVLGTLMVAQTFPDSREATMGLAAAAITLGLATWTRANAGVSWPIAKVRDMLPLLSGAVGTFVGAIVVADVTGQQWVWAIAAAICVVLVLVTGTKYDRLSESPS